MKSWWRIEVASSVNVRARSRESNRILKKDQHSIYLHFTKPANRTHPSIKQPSSISNPFFPPTIMSESDSHHIVIPQSSHLHSSTSNISKRPPKSTFSPHIHLDPSQHLLARQLRSFLQSMSLSLSFSLIPISASCLQTSLDAVGYPFYVCGVTTE
jgi:hypothetical protein